jgi:hypothetical protein
VLRERFESFVQHGRKMRFYLKSETKPPGHISSMFEKSEKELEVACSSAMGVLGIGNILVFNISPIRF